MAGLIWLDVQPSLGKKLIWCLEDVAGHFRERLKVFGNQQIAGVWVLWMYLRHCLCWVQTFPFTGYKSRDKKDFDTTATIGALFFTSIDAVVSAQ